MRGAFGGFRAFTLLDTVSVLGLFGLFGSIGAFSARGLLGVLGAFGRFRLYSPRSACLARLARIWCSARSARCTYFGRSPCSVCCVGVGARVSVAFGPGGGVGKAVDFYADVTVFSASVVNSGMCVSSFVCFGRLCLCFIG